MIVTLTLNPSVDRTIEIEAIASATVDASGPALVAALRLDASIDMDLTLAERS